VRLGSSLFGWCQFPTTMPWSTEAGSDAVRRQAWKQPDFEPPLPAQEKNGSTSKGALVVAGRSVPTRGALSDGCGVDFHPKLVSKGG
jgi:hypothetical protein